MTNFVIDTNVPVIANNLSGEANPDCVISATITLHEAISNGIIFLDDAGEILKEYRRQRLNFSGRPRVGDRFFRLVARNYGGKVRRISVKKRGDGEYEDVPQAIIDSGFDRSDRKFIAVALKSGSKIHVATDSDWVEQESVLEENGVEIVFLCGRDKSQWYLDN